MEILAKLFKHLGLEFSSYSITVKGNAHPTHGAKDFLVGDLEPGHK